MKNKTIAALMTAIVLCITIGYFNINTINPSLNTPQSTIHIYTVNGTTTYFTSTLTDIPSTQNPQNGQNKTTNINKTETIQKTTNNTETPNSNLNPPDFAANIQWGETNDILNHKQNSIMDAQNALWHCSNSTHVNNVALERINETKAQNWRIETCDNTVTVTQH